MMVLWRAGIAWSLLGSSSLVVGAGPIPVRVASSHVLCLLQTYYPPEVYVDMLASVDRDPSPSRELSR